MNIGLKHAEAESETRTSIVILDDEPSILSSLRSLLRRQSYDLHLFERGRDAVEFITHHMPDIIISDMRMPEMSGMEFLDLASVLCPTSTRLMLSGYEDKTIIFDAIAHGIAQQFITKPWEDQEIVRIIGTVVNNRRELQRQHLDHALQSIFSLASPPQAQKQLQRILGNESRSIKDLAMEVEKVPALVARLLRIANSVYYSARVPASTTLEAVGFIGVEYVESLILGMSIHHRSEDEVMKLYANELDELWRHAVHRAILGRSIAERWPGFKEPALAYTVCLLLDVGFLVHFNSNREGSGHFANLIKSMHLTMHQAEPRAFTVSHSIVGAALLRLWNFPDRIVTAVERHHGETRGDVLAQIAQVADIVESGEHTRPHDPAVDPIIAQWQTTSISQ